MPPQYWHSSLDMQHVSASSIKAHASGGHSSAKISDLGSDVISENLERVEKSDNFMAAGD